MQFKDKKADYSKNKSSMTLRSSNKMLPSENTLKNEQEHPNDEITNIDRITPSKLKNENIYILADLFFEPTKETGILKSGKSFFTKNMLYVFLKFLFFSANLGMFVVFFKLKFYLTCIFGIYLIFLYQIYIYDACIGINFSRKQREIFRIYELSSIFIIDLRFFYVYFKLYKNYKYKSELFSMYPGCFLTKDVLLIIFSAIFFLFSHKNRNLRKIFILISAFFAFSILPFSLSFSNSTFFNNQSLFLLIFFFANFWFQFFNIINNNCHSLSEFLRGKFLILTHSIASCMLIVCYIILSVYSDNISSKKTFLLNS